MQREQVQQYIEELQDEICQGLIDVGEQPYREDIWQRDQGGGGRTRIWEDGQIFEKAGVAMSVVYGELPAAARSQASPLAKARGDQFFATGMSLVLHPHNPFIPTVHANYRYFEIGDGDKNEPPKDIHDWWFGGGADLTPNYVDDQNFKHFHQTLQDACLRSESGDYDRFKDTCDTYFYLPHRGETRGIGGIFFEHIQDPHFEAGLELIQNCGRAFLPSYLPMVEQHRDRIFSKQEREWQLLRRGRYVEFNLIYDRGTTFGLKSNGRTESILMSLPKIAHWGYDRQPEKGTPEADMLATLKQPQSWTK